MLDQAEALRRLAQGDVRKESKVKIYTVTSGKGGVGKSNFVVNLAVSLQKQGKRVLVFDADIGMGNDDVLMGIFPKYNIMDVIKEKVSLEEAIVTAPYGVDLLAGGSGLNNISDLSNEERNKFIANIEKMEGYDYIFIDTGAGISKSVLAFIASSNEVIFVLTPEPTSLTDGYSLLKALKHFKIDTKTNVVVNRVFDKEEGNKTYTRFNMAANKFLNVNTNYLGCVYDDKKLTMAVRSQRPVVIEYPSSLAANSIKNIATIINTNDDGNEGMGAKGLMSKLFKIFSR